MPGPGKYETIDCIGTHYNTKSQNHHANSFIGSNRFRTGNWLIYSEKLTPGPQDYVNKTI